jgi:hypothetical protein
VLASKAALERTFMWYEAGVHRRSIGTLTPRWAFSSQVAASVQQGLREPIGMAVAPRHGGALSVPCPTPLTPATFLRLASSMRATVLPIFVAIAAAAAGPAAGRRLMLLGDGLIGLRRPGARTLLGHLESPCCSAPGTSASSAGLCHGDEPGHDPQLWAVILVRRRLFRTGCLLGRF